MSLPSRLLPQGINGLRKKAIISPVTEGNPAGAKAHFFGICGPLKPCPYYKTAECGGLDELFHSQ